MSGVHELVHIAGYCLEAGGVVLLALEVRRGQKQEQDAEEDKDVFWPALFYASGNYEALSAWNSLQRGINANTVRKALEGTDRKEMAALAERLWEGPSAIPGEEPLGKRAAAYIENTKRRTKMSFEMRKRLLILGASLVVVGLAAHAVVYLSSIF